MQIKWDFPIKRQEVSSKVPSKVYSKENYLFKSNLTNRKKI